MPSRVNRLLYRQVHEDLSGDHNIVLVGYRGLSAGDSDAVRKELKDRGLRMRVVRNRVTVKALSDLGRPDMTDLFEGPTAVMDGGEDPVLVAKTAVEFAKRHAALEVRGGVLDGDLVDAEQVKDWAKMPSREEMLSMLAGQILGAGGGLVAALLGPGRTVAGQVKKLGEEEEGDSAGEAA